jgi:hypothetical protein
MVSNFTDWMASTVKIFGSDAQHSKKILTIVGAERMEYLIKLEYQLTLG